jgi:hypothetical protein
MQHFDFDLALLSLRAALARTGADAAADSSA